MTVNPQMISIARESRGMTQAQLAEAMHISQSKLSKYENGTLRVTSEDLSQLAVVLGYTEEFFAQAAEVFGFGSFCFYHRKRAAMSVPLLRRIQAQLNIFRWQLLQIRRGVMVETTDQFHCLDVDAFGGAESVAIEARRLWGIPMGPVKNLVGILERAGGVVWRVDFGTRHLDAVSLIAPGEQPIFFVNSLAPNDRVRFTLAHELGHVLMHTSPSPDMERQADLFASEFMMPRAEVGPNLRNLSLQQLPGLKAHWRVSMAALIKRASDLEKITDRHCRTLFMEFSKSGWRLREPIEISPEHPTVLRDMIHIHLREHGLSVADLAGMVYLRNPSEFSDMFLRGEDTGSLRVVGI
jgi:Zn-dependent peptidase ImmA (M78 family)/transcriptional regulator with XRE-family HTH domain